MARFISCQACSAPVPYDLASSVAICGHCGATVAVPSDDLDPFVERLKTLDQQWKEARRRYMVKDAGGNLLPPPEHSFAGTMISVTGMLPVIAIALLLGALAVAESPWLVPLAFLLPPLGMCWFFGFGYWAIRVHDRSDERYQAFRRIEEVYEREREKILRGESVKKDA